LDCLGVHTAFNLLPLTSGADQTGVFEFLYVMGHCGRRDVHLFAQIADKRSAVAIKHADGSRRAAGCQLLKYFKAIGIRQRLENIGEFFQFFIFIVRHISKYRTKDNFVKIFFARNKIVLSFL
jgi:hypothetical protein